MPMIKKKPSGSAAPAARSYAKPVEETDDDDRPQQRPTGPVRSGWGGAKQTTKSDRFPDRFNFSTDHDLIKFLDDEPIAAYRMHWLKGLRSTKRMSFNCIEDDCPLCAIGDRPRAQIAFNVIHLKGSEQEEPQLKVMTVGSKASKQLESLASSPAGPLSRPYWQVSKSGKDTQTSYNFVPVKERDLAEDWGVDPLSEDEIEAFAEKKFGTEMVSYDTKSYLQEIAEEASE